MITAFYKKHKDIDKDIFPGLLFIPDISGFTELVRATDIKTGRQVTCELLSAVIKENSMQMKLAEIEGDAVLFYREGLAPSAAQLFKQFEKMIASFEAKRKELEVRFAISLKLSLKVIAHYGYMSAYKIGQFKKLYGEVVVEAHRLLKNSIDKGCYLLLTDALFKKPHGQVDNRLSGTGISSAKLCELYSGLKNICFTYFSFNEPGNAKQVA